jgi:hypothetical protein
VGKGRGGGKGGEMTQTLYAHMNKRKNKFKKMQSPNTNKRITATRGLRKSRNQVLEGILFGSIHM